MLAESGMSFSFVWNRQLKNMPYEKEEIFWYLEIQTPKYQILDFQVSCQWMKSWTQLVNFLKMKCTFHEFDILLNMIRENIIKNILTW